MSVADPMLPVDHPARPGAPPPLSPVEAVCAAAVERLKTRLPGKVIVERFPDRPYDYDFEGYEAAALVLYDGSRFDASEQGLREELRLVVSLLVRGLDGENGAYALLADIRAALHGVSLAGSTALRPVEIALEREAQGVWQYRAAFAAAIVAVPVKSARGVALPQFFVPERR